MKYNKNDIIKFNLKKLKKNGKPVQKNLQIFLTFNLKSRRLRYYTGERIDLKYWDDKNQRAISNYERSLKLNDFLDSLREFVKKEYRESKIMGNKPTVQYLRERLNERLKSKSSNSFFDIFNQFIVSSKNIRAINTVKKYRSTLNHLIKFSSSCHYTIEFESINKEFEGLFLNYMISEVRLTNNTIATYIKALKVFLNYTTDRGLNTTLDYKNFKAKEEEGEVIFLTYEELMRLYNLEITNAKLSEVRDLFCFGCFTSLRYSEIINLKKDNIFNDAIHYKSIKTKKTNIIPLNQFSKSILEKYQDSPSVDALPVISNQKMNQYLKDLGQLAELNEPVNLIFYRGSERIEKIVPKHEVLTTHIARKTFITNALDRGMPTEVIMDISTHSSPRVFKRYYKVLDRQKKREMLKIFGNELQ